MTSFHNSPPLKGKRSRELLKKALIDASSAILLFKAELFETLIHTFHIRMTEMVLKELTRPGYPGTDQFLEFGQQVDSIIFLKRDRIAAMEATGDLSFLDAGERDTILAYFLGQGDFIIIDDGKGAGYCRQNRIPYINALLFPRILYLGGRISRAVFNDRTRAIIQAGRYTDAIIAFARTCGKHDLRRFMP